MCIHYLSCYFLFYNILDGISDLYKEAIDFFSSASKIINKLETTVKTICNRVQVHIKFGYLCNRVNGVIPGRFEGFLRGKT